MRTTQVTSQPTIHVARQQLACVVCAGLHAKESLHYSSALGGEVCPTCRESGREIYQAAANSARRHLHEIRQQLPQLIRDRRAGGEIPVFYRGYE